ncbi:MAG: hypothetical protein QOE63_1368 [Acidimicrobiaceae bacterium]|jgi:ribosomal protein S27E
MVDVAKGQVRTLECPGCGLVREVDRFRRTAGEFCARCDYPLFFAPTATAQRTVEAERRSDVERALRRLPGDQHRFVTMTCPECDERNPATNVTCLRCGALLHPPPVMAAPAPLEPEPIEVPPQAGRARRRLDPALVAILVIVVLTLGLLLAIVRT